MFRQTLMAGVLSIGLAGAALAQPMPSMTAPPPGASTQALPTPDLLTAAGQSDQFEIREAKLAEMRSHDPQVLKLARMMVHDHTESTRMMMAAAKAAGLPPMAPPGLSMAQNQMLATLKSTSAADFNRVYVSQQVQAHEKTLAVLQAYATGGPAGPIRSTAGKIVPTVQTHLSKWRALQGAMG